MEENRHLQKNSTSSLILSSQQQIKQIQLLAIPKLSAGIKNVAVRIVENIHDAKIKDMPMKWVIMLVGTLRAMVGDTDTSETQLNMEASWIHEQYALMPAGDIKMAFELFIKGELDFQVPDYFKFSNLSLGRVLSSFARFKNRIVGELDRMTEKEMLELEQTNTIDKRLQAIKEIIADCFGHYKEGFKERFYNQLTYDFLRKTERIRLSADMVEKARTYADKKWIDDTETDKKEKRKISAEAEYADIKTKMPEQIGSSFLKPPALLYDKTKAIRLYAIEYCIAEYFKTHEKTIDKIIEAITLSDLTKIDQSKP